MSDPTAISATELASAIRVRRLSATEAMRAYLDRMARLNPALNAVIHLDAERALARAARADRIDGPKGRLHGLPMTLKDSHRVAGMPTIVGNPEAPRAPARRDGYVAGRLQDEGAIIVGKTNVARDLADFQTENPVFGRTANPWDPARTPGGSSGGAAAAVAARLTPIEVGSDIAGSVRLPAHLSGIIGLKPSAGLIPVLGHVTQPVEHPRGGGVGILASIGPLARTFDDVAALLDILGTGPRPATAFTPSETSIGVLGELPGLRVAAAISEGVDRLAHEARRHGVRIQRIGSPVDAHEQHAAWVEVYRAAESHGASWEHLAPRVVRGRDLARQAWADALRRHDAILLAPAMCTAFTHRPTGSPIEVDGVPVPYWGLARLMEPFNLTGLPAIVFPVGLDSDGLPIGAQLVGGFGRDRWLIRAAEWLASFVEPLPAPPT